jgi:hypothetical protein
MSPCHKLRVLAVNNQQRRNGVRMNCIYLLRAKNVHFCLRLKEVGTRCPPRCPFFREGIPGSYQGALEREIDIDCLYVTRTSVPRGGLRQKSVFYCSLYKSPRPLCPRCLYAKYKAEPTRNKGIIDFYKEE